MSKFQVYTNPQDASVKLNTDDGFHGTGQQNVDSNGRPGQVIDVIDGHPSGHGAELIISKEGYEQLRVRGFFVIEDNVARLQVDDYTLTPVSVPPTTPPDSGEESDRDPNANPLEIINHVFNSTNPNLSTNAGCGKFTEDCCKELHDTMHPAWGHIKKNPGQNQFNGHAVDAIMLLVPSGGTAPGIYDIIQSSASSDARPVFNYVEPPNPELWYYPPGTTKSAGQLKSR